TRRRDRSAPLRRGRPRVGGGSARRAASPHAGAQPSDPDRPRARRPRRELEDARHRAQLASALSGGRGRDPRREEEIRMKRLFALSAIGHDRPGIVADLAELIYECDCNLEDSRMTLLGSEFAVLLLLSGQGADAERRLTAGCKRLEWEKRLTVFFRPL